MLPPPTPRVSTNLKSRTAFLLAKAMSHTSSPPHLPVHLDGTTLEGGGQLLRLALSISSLTKIPIRVTDIRGKRASKSKPGGGLKSSHLAGAQWLAQATGAETVGMEIKSRDLVFRPRSYGNLPVESTVCIDDNRLNGETAVSAGFWRDIYDDGTRASHISMSTPGSIFLVLQAILPYILFSCASISSNSALSAKPAPVRLTIEGGTNVDASLSYEYAEQVLFPILHEKLGVGPIKMTLQRRGWSMGRADVGSVIFEITPIKPKQGLRAFSLADRGVVAKIHVSLLAYSLETRASIRDIVVEEILKRHPDVEILFAVDEDSRNSKRLYLLLVAETCNGYRLGRDWLFDEKIKEKSLDQTLHRLVTKVVRDLEHELAHGGCVDEHLQDQLVVFQALADGESHVLGGEASLHTRTAQWVVETILGPRFEHGKCQGIGFMAGQRQWKSGVASSIAKLEAGVAELDIERV